MNIVKLDKDYLKVQFESDEDMVNIFLFFSSSYDDGEGEKETHGLNHVMPHR